MKRISILGSTGSIGRQCLSVVDAHPGLCEVVALAAGSNVELIAKQILRHRPKVVSVGTEEAARELCALVHEELKIESIEILFGPEGMARVSTHPEADTVVSAAVGVVGLAATYQAIEQGKDIALANKEVLVAAGEVVMAAVERHKVALLPVDSEHNAIHQCLRAGERAEVKRLVLTASGGPFARRRPRNWRASRPSRPWRIPTGKWGSESPSIPPRL